MKKITKYSPLTTQRMARNLQLQEKIASYIIKNLTRQKINEILIIRSESTMKKLKYAYNSYKGSDGRAPDTITGCLR